MGRAAPLGAEGAGIAQAVELQRRRPQRQHAGAAVVGVAHQINRHVDAISADALMAERWPTAIARRAASNLNPSRRGEPMASVQEIRQRLRGQRIEALRSSIEPLLAGKAGSEVWLFGSLARGDWDARSDVDLLAVAPDQSAADQLAEALLGAGLADDVIGLSQGRWLERRRGDDPWWRGICRDAIRLQPLQKR